MTLSERIALYRKFTDAILTAGPDIQEDLSDLMVIRDATVRIVTRTSKRFGFSAVSQDVMMEADWKAISNDAEVRNLEQQFMSKVQGFASNAPAGLPSNTVVSASDALAGKTVRPASSAMAAPSAPGDWVQIIRQLFEAFMANPQLLTFILSLFKKPA